MTHELKQLIAITLLVLGLLQGTNMMVAEEPDTAGWMWVLILLGGSLLVWLWTRRESHSAEEAARDAIHSAEESLSRFQTTADSIENGAASAPKKTEPPPTKPESVAAVKPEPGSVTAKPEPAVEVSAEPDDLTRIEGVGPAYRDILVNAGISTFAKLAAMSEDEIVNLIRENGGRKHRSMSTWAEQAKLAAAGNWDGLAKLQGSLKGGSRG